MAIVGIRLRVHGAEHIQVGRSAVYAFNHSSNVEPPLCFLTLHRLFPHLRILYKAELRKLPLSSACTRSSTASICWAARAGGRPISSPRKGRDRAERTVPGCRAIRAAPGSWRLASIAAPRAPAAPGR